MNQLDFTFGKTACFFDLARGANRAAFSAQRPKAMLYFSRKHDIPVVTDPQDLEFFKTVFFSLHCFRDFYLVADIARYKRSHHEWIAGGNAAASPRSIAWIMDYVWIGSCENGFAHLLRGEREFPCLYSSNKDNAVVYNDEDLLPEPLSESEIVMSKGCPRRCLFCIHPWRTKYQEQKPEVVSGFIESRNGKGIGLVSNSSDDVSYYKDVSDQLYSLGKTDMIVSNAVQGLTSEVIAKRKREMLLGVEGMSERLRRYVNKPIRRSVLREKIDLCLQHNRQIRTVYQFNLPGETLRDFDELKEDVEYFRSRYKRGSWAIPFIPNQPSAHTPFQWLRPRYSWEMFDVIQEFRKSLYGSRHDGIALYTPAPLGGNRWFAQVVAEWLPITPKVAETVRKIPPRLSVEQMVEFLSSRDVKLPSKFLDRSNDENFPWDKVRMQGDDPNIRRRFDKMMEKINNECEGMCGV